MDSCTRNLAWKLNWYRQSELEGALLLGRLVRFAAHGELIANLMKHCADEARHGHLWSDCLRKLGLPYIRIHRSYQSLFLSHGAAPASLVEVLAFTQVFERRVHKRFTEELADPALPPAARTTFEIMLEDEKAHLAWVHDWLKVQPDSSAWLKSYTEIDLALYRQIQPFLDRLWEIPGLGEDLPCAATFASHVS